MKRAFTLIELLVVIAIIAILAAILFPVFAQAKIAAKATASLSDTKQTALGLIMYANDASDYWCNGASWGTGSDPLCYGGGACFSTWTWLVLPYMKNEDIEVDALGPNPVTPGGWSKVLAESFNPTFKYNVAALAPYYGPPLSAGVIGQSHAISDTGVDQPANCVMITAGFSTTEAAWAQGCPGCEGLGWSFAPNPADNGPVLQTVQDPPDCYTIHAYCIDNWGTGSYWYAPQLNNSFAAGAITAGNSMRGTGANEVAFCDGHSKKLMPGALAAGTNWSTTTAVGALTVNNVNNYLWWAQPSTGN